jgi:hypothetical protein
MLGELRREGHEGTKVTKTAKDLRNFNRRAVAVSKKFVAVAFLRVLRAFVPFPPQFPQH